ncbi:phage protein NinX family protein [Providencia stuartii]|uniref:phage protein NinX family protein n=1 Tax=Providencia stuartii TaxID=588 RepID=UPI00300C63B9
MYAKVSLALSVSLTLYFQLKRWSDGYKTEENRGNFDPCNNPSNAMPIIIENKICMNYIDGDIGWCAYHFDEEKGELEIYDKNYYRVAMILFLLMKDAENEG